MQCWRLMMSGDMDVALGKSGTVSDEDRAWALLKETLSADLVHSGLKARAGAQILSIRSLSEFELKALFGQMADRGGNI